MRILPTRASGFIGQHLLGALLADGHHVVCAGRTANASTDPRLSFIHADFAQDALNLLRPPTLINIKGLRLCDRHSCLC